MQGVMLSSLPQPLGYILVCQLNFHVRSAGAGKLISAVGIAEVTPQPCELGWHVIVPVFLCNHLLEKNKQKKARVVLLLKPYKWHYYTRSLHLNLSKYTLLEVN